MRRATITTVKKSEEMGNLTFYYQEEKMLALPRLLAQFGGEGSGARAHVD